MYMNGMVRMSWKEAAEQAHERGAGRLPVGVAACGGGCAAGGRTDRGDAPVEPVLDKGRGRPPCLPTGDT
jgi:hypothetical protein